MKTRISAFVDGELPAHEVDAVLVALREKGDAHECWRTYHLISDAMRDLGALSPDFSARVAERLEAEPTVLAPLAHAPTPVAAGPGAARRVWAAAAGVSAVALVGWLALMPAQETIVPAPLAAIPAPATPVPQTPQAAPLAATPIPLPGAASDYLLAHQAYSPRVTLQGVAPYVRTVAEPGGELRAR
ncbi:MAG: sigma-E factor negative regulatory protein [Proteobacteria bacterium]|nr:sigma-E factor negative regulatory protein [Pseudomonadota bacterium]